MQARAFLLHRRLSKLDDSLVCQPPIDAIRTGTQIRPDFRDGLAVQRVLDAAVASAGGNRGAVEISVD